MHIIDVINEYDPKAEMRCDCGVWREQADTDIEIMAKGISHIRDAHSGEGVIEFPRRYVVVTDSSVTVLEK